VLFSFYINEGMKSAICGYTVRWTMAKRAAIKKCRIPLKMTVNGTPGTAAFKTKSFNPTGLRTCIMAVSIGIHMQSLKHLQHLRLDTQELPDKHTMALYGLDSNLVALLNCLGLPVPLLNPVLCLAQPNPRGH